ncbi:MAG: AAA family ATPase [Mojavia pulchra JT2-VF2]|uniref:histidine kinase n=1 Tax=Mojavia pulchra JT2-VF2 TaxID=287848 RepID=A0A951PXB4_9NOST|nr:AAA family ATPase [Mojavia pulchra JT2-VF2]
MLKVSDYIISEQIYASTRTLVYKGIRASDQIPVVIKVMQNEYPSFSEIVQFRNQYTIAKNLDIPGIVRPYSLKRYHNGYALVMEDFGGISLTAYAREQQSTEDIPDEGESQAKLQTLKSQIPLTDFLAIAIQIATILDELHRGSVIHKDLKPANILIDPTSQQVKLIDFSIASLLPKETQAIQNPNVLEGTLAYLSPEQTGRMNRGIDYRSDFYSLGVTFYELLTGQLPFQSSDAMELIHCHLAKQAVPVYQVNPAVPQVLSEIVAKLMAKNAEDRYQSALGLRHDLEICLLQWQETGQIESFALGQRDICDRFLIPEKLYGREAEVKTLLQAFERVSNGKTEMLLVAGFSGIGKTAVVKEVHKPIVRQHGYFIKGKYDQFGRNIPLAAFVQAFRDLIGQLLSESDIQLEQWRTKILDAVGENAQVLIEVIPELERIIGHVPTVPELSGSAAQNRFNLVFQKFAQVFTRVEHPLVLFLDDLQWADSASLKLLQLLMTDAGHLLVIGAYRDNEVNPAHPLMLTLAEIEKTGAIVNTITLAPLQQANLNHLVADTLSCSTSFARPLTELAYQKTKGNPFFATQFLKSLHEDGLIAFDFEVRHWQCDLAKVKALALTDDVVEFMGLQLQKLPQNTQEVLKLAACIGNSFDLATLAIVREKSQTETAADLWRALQEGLILPVSEVYKFYQGDTHQETQLPTVENQRAKYRFLHDRVQQAAYSLICDDHKQATHLKIGQLLLHATSDTEQEEKLFDIIGHLNLGRQLLTQPQERADLAEFNLNAGRKARTSTAYAAALEFTNVGIGLLKADCWQTQYDLALALHETAAEVAYLSGEFEQMEQAIETVIHCAKTRLDRVKVYKTKIEAQVSHNNLPEAISTARHILKLFGVIFPENPTPDDIQYTIQEISQLIAARNIEDLIHLPVMTDAEQLAIMQISSSVIVASFVSGSPLFPLIVGLQVKLSIVSGNTPLSAFSYACYGIVLVMILQDIHRAYQFGQLALNIVSKFDVRDDKPNTFSALGLFIIHGKSHIRETLSVFKEGYHAALEVGNLGFAGYNAHGFCLNSYWSSQPLITLEPKVRAYACALFSLKEITSLNYCHIYWQTILNLVGNTAHPCVLSGEAMQEEELLSRLLGSNDQFGLYFFYLHKFTLCFLLGDVAQALENAAQTKQYFMAGAGTVGEPVLYFYDSLAALASYCDSCVEQETLLQRVAENQAKLHHWAHNAPMNYLDKWYLVEAERHRVLGNKAEAIEHYDRAIALAQENEYLNEEALANELAAKFYLAWGKEKIAQDYLLNAYYAYSRWGAKAKVNDLEQCYPRLLAPILQQQQTQFKTGETILSFNSTSATSHSSSISTVLDLATILTASQTLSREIELEKLLSTLLQIVIENAGASKCVFLLVKDDSLVVEAIAFSTPGANTQLEPPGNLVSILPSVPVNASQEIPQTLINTVKRTLSPAVITDASVDIKFATDPYILQKQPKSILCSPILNQGKLIGILYLENHLTVGAFTTDRVELLNLLVSQAAISLENARLYQKAQNYTQQLEKSLEDLKQAQLQLVQSEKMSALGNLIAGVAHEINNPIGFIAGNIEPALNYVKDVFGVVDLYQEKFPNPGTEIEDEIETIDLDYIRSDLPKLLSSMKQGVQRIRSISNSLRTFSRADTEDKVAFNIHDGIDSTILILKHRLKANENCSAIEVVKDYGNIPQVQCFPGQLNQVFMNLLANAIDALEESNIGRSIEEIQARPNRITVKTSMSEDTKQVVISIKDNGMGMTEEVKQRIFDHLFTTKTVGKGTGLGLAIARQIVVEKHGGTINVSSTVGEGAEFAINIPL